MSASEPEFGHAGHPWPLDLNRDPCDTGARYLQHRLIVAARQVLGESANATTFHEALGGKYSPKKVQRHLSGTLLSVSDLLYWSHALNVDLSELVGAGMADTNFLPPLYRGQKLSARGQPPRYLGSELDWGEIVRTISARVRDEYSDAIDFFTSDVLRLIARQALITSGVRDPLLQPAPLGLRVLGKQATLVGTYAVRADTQEWGATREALVAPDVDVLIAVLDPTAAAICHEEFPGLLTSPRGATFEIPVQAYEQVQVPVNNQPVLWQVIVTSNGDPVLLSLQRKRTQSTDSVQDR